MSLLQVRHIGSLDDRAADQSSLEMTHSYCVYSSPRHLKLWVSNGIFFFNVELSIEPTLMEVSFLKLDICIGEGGGLIILAPLH